MENNDILKVFTGLKNSQRAEIVSKLMAIDTKWECENHAFNPLLPIVIEVIWQDVIKEPLRWAVILTNKMLHEENEVLRDN